MKTARISWKSLALARSHPLQTPLQSMATRRNPKEADELLWEKWKHNLAMLGFGDNFLAMTPRRCIRGSTF